MKTIFILFIIVFATTEISAQDTAIFKIRSPKKSIDTINPDVYVYVDEMPEFEGGPSAMLKYISTNLDFPISALSGFGGTGFYAFIVNADGSIGKVIVRRGVSDCPECDKEAIRVIKSMPPFRPARINNVAVPMWVHLPIRFRL